MVFTCSPNASGATTSTTVTSFRWANTKSCTSMNAHRVSATRSKPRTAKPLKSLEALSVQSGGQIDGLAGVFAAQRAVVLPPQEHGKCGDLGGDADEHGDYRPRAIRIEIGKQYRQSADTCINQRHAFVDRASETHGRYLRRRMVIPPRSNQIQYFTYTGVIYC